MSDYDQGLADGYMQGLAKAQQLIAQALADGLPRPDVDEPEDTKPEERGTR